MPNGQFGAINEQGYLGEGFGFTEATEEDQQKFKEDEKKGNQTDKK